MVTFLNLSATAMTIPIILTLEKNNYDYHDFKVTPMTLNYA